MKSAEEWADKAMKETGDLLVNKPYYVKWAEQIQLDAHNAAVTAASELSHDIKDRTAILTLIKID